jgi:cobalt-zinc-cadmium efflux system outer membrane protein
VALAVARCDARARAFAAYVRAQAAARRLAESRASGEVARRVLEATRVRGQLGASGDIEESTAALEVAQLGAAEEDAQGKLAWWTMELRDALDLAPEEEYSLTSAIDDPPPAPEAALLVERALRASPDLAEVRSRYDLLGATDERLARETAPRVGVYGGVDAAPLSPVYGVAGLSVEIPVAQRNQGPRARVARERETEMARLDVERRRLARDVTARRAAYEARRSELARLRSEALPAAERAFALIETGWRAGRFDVFRVTTAARDVVRVRAAQLDAMEGAWLERAALERALGSSL